MINFFRKIRQNLLIEDERNEGLQEQNQVDGLVNRTTTRMGRMSKYLKYAIGEKVLVVIGILIALQINNWNENAIKAYQKSLELNPKNESATKALSALQATE